MIWTLVIVAEQGVAMKTIWCWGTVVTLAVGLGAGVAAQQTKPQTIKKSVVKQEAKEADEQGEEQQAKKYAIAAQLPGPITAAFKKDYPAATIRGTAKETENGKTVYEVESVDKGMARDLIYNPDGTVVEIEEQIIPANLPALVSAALKKLYPTATITVAEKLTKGPTVQYELQLKGALKPSVAFFPDGKLVPAEPPK
jgi:hypothetical protein